MIELALDDVITYLLQLEPADREDLARVREQLADLAFGNKVGIAVQPIVARAVRALKPLVDGTAPDPAAALAEVGALLEAAIGDGRAPATSGAVMPIIVPPSERAPSAVPVVPADVGTALGTESLPADVDLDLLADFLAESRECLAGSEAALLALEHSPDDAEAVNTVFRAFHTIKGTSAFLGLTRVSAFAHEAESLLARVREGTIAYTAGCAELALRSVDMLKLLLDAIDHTVRGAGPGGIIVVPDDYGALAGALATYDPTAAPPARATVLVPATAPDVDGPREGERRQGDRRQGDRRQGAGAEPDQFLRIRTDRLDRLVDLVGELVIAQAMITGDGALAATGDTSPPLAGLAKKLGHASKIVRELQEVSMGMRMVPLKAVFQKMTRLVRDVSTKVGKEVVFVTEGEDTEIDRALVDVIGDPLVHMVRNAIDHGIEPADERAAAGKPRHGTVRLSAFHAGGSVVVELVDDGRGLNRDLIARKAVAKGIIASEHGMSDAEIFQLIFAPGFSTVDQVTDLSGRGVGMDVVRRNVERVRGRVEIASRLGAGTTFTVRLPLTLAMTDGMLVRVGSERYVVPTTSIYMSFRPAAGTVRTIAGGGEVAVLRGDVLPIVRLHRIFGIDGAEHDPARALLVIVGDGRERRSALLVDELLSQQQVVAKPLGDGVGRVQGVAGGAILGDGRVGLIVDVAEVLALAERGEALAVTPPFAERSAA
ncbi:MAG TPA: chemotaxis protein CheA [Gemmatirosa sp.]